MNQPGLLASFAAGLVSFISPCVLPLLPAYLSMLSGLAIKDLAAGGAGRSAGSGAAGAASNPDGAGTAGSMVRGPDSAAARDSRRRLVRASMAFSAGFTLTFTMLGILFSGGMAFAGAGFSQTFGKIAGIIVMLLGLNLIFDFISFLNSDVRLLQLFSGSRNAEGTGSWRRRGSMLNAFLMGLAFAAGWSPCIGPILASVLLMAARNADIGRAALLLAGYSAGFAVPFILSALFFGRLSPLLNVLKKHGNAVRIVSGVFLLLFGLVMFLGSVSRISALAAQAGAGLINFRQTSPLAARLAGSVLWLVLSIPALRAFYRARRGAAAANTRAERKPRPQEVFLIMGGLGLLLVILEAAGQFSIIQAVGTWLTFSGI